MKKKETHKKVLNWIKDAWLKAIVVLLIVAGGFYAYAAISWPADEPNPTTGVVGMFVGESKNPFSATTNNYDKANDLCASGAIYPTAPAVIIPGTHICSSMEMMNSYNHGKLTVAQIYKYLADGGSTMLYINNGPPGYTANSNDCVGWTKTTKGTDPQNPNYGAVWNFQAMAGGLTPCNAGKKFACCK